MIKNDGMQNETDKIDEPDETDVVIGIFNPVMGDYKQVHSKSMNLDYLKPMTQAEIDKMRASVPINPVLFPG